MQRQSITEFLHEKVYPEIDAVSSGLLDHLKPTKLQTSGTYRMLCPACGMHEAFHHPGTHLIHCPRKKNCGESTSLWDVMEKSGYSRKEIVERLCDLARVAPLRTKILKVVSMAPLPPLPRARHYPSDPNPGPQVPGPSSAAADGSWLQR